MTIPNSQPDPTTLPSSLELDAQNPWPGLATYDENARDFFFGRETEVEELLRLIKLSSLTALYGKSGLGKSSLLQAGLFPRLRAAYFLPVYIRLDTASAGNMPFSEQVGHWLRQAMYDAKADYPPFAPEEDLWCYLHRRDLEIWSPDNHLLTPVLVFDQFEEVFARVHPNLPEPRVLCHGLADLIENKLPSRFAAAQADKAMLEPLDLLSQRYRVLLSFREDFLPALKNWERDVPSLLKNWCQLLPMSRECAVEAVRQSGTEVLADGAAKDIVDFVGNLDPTQTGGETVIEPVLLSLCCYQLNVRRQAAKAKRIDVELLRKVGQEILEGYYAHALAGMPSKVAVFIETKLIQGDRYRSSYPVKLALDEGLLSEKQLGELTDKHRLLRVDQQMGTPRIELIHDRLVSVVRKIRDRRQTRTELRRAWLAAAGGLLLILSIGGWLRWEGINDKEKLLETTEALLNRVRQQSMVSPDDIPIVQYSQQLLYQRASPEPGEAAKAVKPPADATKHIIYLQIRDNSQREAAQKLREWLKQQNYVVPGIEQLPKGPPSTEVRYFRAADANHAQVLVESLSKQKVANVTIRYIAGFEDSKIIPQGQYEIWFAPDAFQ